MRIFPIVLALVLLSCASRSQAPATGGERLDAFRGIWVTRWDYRTEEDVRRVMAEVAGLGVTDVMWQVRGQADAFYRSRLEPWGEELLAGLPAGRRDPGFDPLSVAVREAHRHGMRIHAWVNVFPLWKGTTPANDSSHLMHARPEWWLMDQTGSRQPLNEHYVILNPVLSEVHDHVVAVVKDIASRYAVDGIHLDYIRFVSETHEKGKLYPGDGRTMALYRAAGGKGTSAPEDMAHFRGWVRGRITDLVARLRREVVGPRKDLVLTAAVWRDPSIARETYLQDAAAWVRDGLIDRAMPMIYSDDNAAYAKDVEAWLAAAPPSRITPGIGTYKHTDGGMTVRQVAIGERASGFALFAYAALFESADPNQPKDAKSKAERAARLRVIRDSGIFR